MLTHSNAKRNRLCGQSAAIILGLLCVLSASRAAAASLPRYKDRIAIFDMRSEFSGASNNLGFLTATKNLTPDNSKEVEKLQNDLRIIKEKYRSQYTDSAWASSQSLFDQGVAEARDLDGRVPAGKPYACTYSIDGNGKSQYVDRVNDALRGLKLSVYRFQKKLSTPANSGALMLTQSDYDRIQGPLIQCGSSSRNTAVPQPLAVTTTQVQMKTKVRVPPYSSSRNPRHEMLCRNLEEGIPAPLPLLNGARCVYNYKMR